MAFSFTPFFGIIPTLTLLAILFTYSSILREEKARSFLIISAFLLLITLFIHVPFYNTYGFPEIPDLLERNVLQELISDLGGLQAYSTFSLLLALIGFSSLWWSNKKNKPAYTIFLVMFFASLFYEGVPFYLNFFISIFAGFALMALIKRKWQLELIKTFTILLLIYGVIFSTATYLVRLNTMDPNNELVESLEWLKENSEETDVVFSHYTNGFLIQAISDRRVLLDEKFDYINQLERLYSDSETILNSRNLKNTTSMMNKHSVSYIFITNKMKHELWRDEEEGLIFLFNDKDAFRKVYSNKEAEIWRFTNVTN